MHSHFGCGHRGTPIRASAQVQRAQGKSNTPTGAWGTEKKWHAHRGVGRGAKRRVRKFVPVPGPDLFSIGPRPVPVSV